MNIYEMLKEGKTPDYIRVQVEKEIKSAQTIIEEEKAAKKEEIKETRKNLVDAFEDYYFALTGKWFDGKDYDSLGQILEETEKEIIAVQHDLKEIEKLKKFSEKLPKKPFVREKTCAVKFTPKETDDEVIKNFINNLI